MQAGQNQKTTTKIVQQLLNWSKHYQLATLGPLQLSLFKEF